MITMMYHPPGSADSTADLECRLEKDLEKLSTLNPSMFECSFPFEGNRNKFILKVKKSNELWLNENVSFECIIPANYPSLPPLVRCTSSLSQNEYDSLIDIEQRSIVNRNSGVVTTSLLRTGAGGCWSSYFSLLCVAHSLRQMFLKNGFAGCAVTDISLADKTTIERKEKNSSHSKAQVRFKTLSASYELQGKRPTMEDASVRVDRMVLRGNVPSRKSFYAVFDGHGGSAASRFTGTHIVTDELNSGKSESEALWNASLSMDKNFLKDITSPSAILARGDKGGRDASGTTAICALFDGRRSLFVSNVGDSRAVLCRKGKALNLSSDHKPDPSIRPDECARIVAAGGFIFMGRVMGQLAICRAIGDINFKSGAPWLENVQNKSISSFSRKKEGKYQNESQYRNSGKPVITAEPELSKIDLLRGDEFLLLACDGLFDVFSSQAAVDFIINNLKEHGDINRACKNIVESAVKDLGSTDNVSCVLVSFQQLSNIGNRSGGYSNIVSNRNATFHNDHDDDDDDDDDDESDIFQFETKSNSLNWGDSYSDIESNRKTKKDVDTTRKFDESKSQITSGESGDLDYTFSMSHFSPCSSPSVSIRINSSRGNSAGTNDNISETFLDKSFDSASRDGTIENFSPRSLQSRHSHSVSYSNGFGISRPFSPNESMASTDIERAISALDLSPTRTSIHSPHSPNSHSNLHGQGFGVSGHFSPNESVISTDIEREMTPSLDSSSRQPQCQQHSNEYNSSSRVRSRKPQQNWRSLRSQEDELMDYVMSDDASRDIGSDRIKKTSPPIPPPESPPSSLFTSEQKRGRRSLIKDRKVKRGAQRGRRSLSGLEDELLDFLYDDKNF